MKVRRWLKIMAPVLLALLAGCDWQREEPLRIGINGWPAYEYLYLAERKGMFAEEGVDVRLVQLGSLQDSRRAFERGVIDGMASTVVEVLQAQANTARDPQVFMVTDYSSGGDVVLAQPGIEAIAQLKGRRVGLEFASVGVLLLTRMLESAGLGLADVQQISADQLTMEAMFLRGELDAAVTYAPVANSLQQLPGVSTLFTSTAIPGEIVDVLSMDRGILQTHPEKAAAVIRAYFRAVAYAAAHRDEALQIMGEREGLSPAAFGETLNAGMRPVPLAEQSGYMVADGQLLSALRNAQKIMRQSGQLQSDGDVARLVNPLPLQQALAAGKP